MIKTQKFDTYWKHTGLTEIPLQLATAVAVDNNQRESDTQIFYLNSQIPIEYISNPSGNGQELKT